MKVIRLAVLGAAAYGVKKWLDENPTAKQQVREAADTAKVQAKHAAETVKHQVDERRSKGPEAEGVGDTYGGDPLASDLSAPVGGTTVGDGAVGTSTTGWPSETATGQGTKP
jgi:septal ring factor EnvC (AmiA/AmiB activator)